MTGSEVLRVRAREPDSLDPAHRVASAQELAELGDDVGREVAAPGVHVLAERVISHAVPGERLHLGDDVTRAAALLPPTDRGDDAVGALRVAAHRDLHPGAEPTLALHRQGRRERLVRSEPAAWHREATGLDPLAEVRDRAGPNATSTNGYRSKIRSLRLRVAAAGRHEIRLPTLARRGITQVRRQLGVRLLANGAGVEHEYVGVARLGRLAETERLEHALDPLGVVSVHLAAERGDVVPAHNEPV